MHSLHSKVLAEHLSRVVSTGQGCVWRQQLQAPSTKEAGPHDTGHFSTVHCALQAITKTGSSQPVPPPALQGYLGVGGYLHAPTLPRPLLYSQQELHAPTPSDIVIPVPQHHPCFSSLSGCSLFMALFLTSSPWSSSPPTLGSLLL